MSRTGMIKTTTFRAKSSVSQVGAGKRIESADGLRWAISRNSKRSLGFGRYDVVEAWTLRERINGKAVIVRSGVTEERAREFCGGAA